MTIAVNNHEKEKVRSSYEKIANAEVDGFLKKRASLAVAYFDDDLEKLDSSFKRTILNDLNQNDNWIFNVNALRLFSSAMIILPPDNVEAEIAFFFRKISRTDTVSDVMQERYATICDNYLHWKYDQIKNKKQLKIDENVEAALDYLKNLTSSAHNIIYLISARYYSALFTKNIKRAQEIKKELIDMGCTLVVNNWPV